MANGETKARPGGGEQMAEPSTSKLSLASAALQYAARGWAVLPLKPRGKEPLTPHGVKDATTNPEVISQWWERWQGANIGIATGPRSGLLVLDVDGAEGEAALQGKLLPPTPIVLTGKGRHIYFQHPGFTVRNGVGVLPGLDLKADGGYVVAPPSLHPSGKQYRWEEFLSAADTPVAPPPDWVLSLSTSNQPGRPVAARIVEGTRNDTLTRVAGSLRRQGFDESVIFEVLTFLNSRLCDPPLGEKEITSIVKSIIGYAPGEVLFKPKRAAEFLAAPAPEVRWVVKGLLPRGGLSLIVGKPKVGKTTLARALAVDVAQGRPFLGRETRPGPVLYLGLEGRESDHRGGFEALGLRPDDPFFFHEEGTIKQLAAWVHEARPALVIVDTVAGLLSIKDFADYAMVRMALDPLEKLAREVECALVLLHHAAKGSDQREAVDSPLGSTAFGGAVDTILVIKRRSDNVRTVQTVQRVGEELPETVLRIGLDGSPELVQELQDFQVHQIAQQILNRRWQGETIQEIRETVGGKGEHTVRALQVLVAEGKIERRGGGKKGDPFRFYSFPNYIHSVGNAETNPEKPATSGIFSFPGISTPPGNEYQESAAGEGSNNEPGKKVISEV